MTEKEALFPCVLEYSSGHAGVVQKGQKAKTTFLVGCFAPVIRYENMILLGHYGWGQSTEARSQLPHLIPHRQSPISLDLYRIDLETSNAWYEHDMQYDHYLNSLKDVLSKVTHIPRENISTPSYPDYSVVVVDWTESLTPHVYVERA